MIVAQVFVVVQVNNNEIKFIKKKKKRKEKEIKLLDFVIIIYKKMIYFLYFNADGALLLLK